MGNYIGVDLGGTKIAGIVINDRGETLFEETISTLAEEGQEVVIERINSVIKGLMAKTEGEPVRGIGLCAPGPLSVQTGVIIDAPNLRWKNVPIVSILEQEFGLPIVIENDANAAAIGECYYGAGQGTTDMIYITVSTGIGGGIISRGELVYGRDYSAGEVGHMVVLPDGPLCGCGRKGCIEALASGTAIARQAREKLKEGAKSLMRELVDGNLDLLTAREVAEAAREGDKLALSVLDQAFWYLSVALGNLVNLLNPEIILIGGGVAKMGPLLFDKVNQYLEEEAFSHMVKGLPVVPARLGGRAGSLGVVTLARKKMGR